MPKGKILITEEMHPSLAERLNETGYECDIKGGISYDDVIHSISQYRGVIVATRIRIDKKIIDASGQLRFIARAGSGMENIDVNYAASKGIVCINSPEGNANSVAEHALGLLLAVFHNITKSVYQTSRQQWRTEENRVHELEGKTIGIIGYGNTGRAFAKMLHPFKLNVLAYDKYLKQYGDEYAEESTMEKIFDEAEIISLHIPLTDETLWMIGRNYLQRFTRPIHLINTSRGKIIKHAELLQSIMEGKILSAACDVFENENFSEQTAEERTIFLDLIKTEKVIFTPHIAGKSYESKKKIADTLIAKISALI